MFAQNTVTAFPSVAISAPAQYLVIDLETGNAPAEAIENAINSWEPPKYYKDPEKIEAKRKEEFNRIMERGALLDASPILCAAVKTRTARLLINGMGGVNSVEGWKVYDWQDERKMLYFFREWLNDNTNMDSAIVGHNVRGFDLPKLRNAYLRHRLKLPELLAITARPDEGPQVVDTAQLFKAFSMEHRNDFCPSISDMAYSLGLPMPKAVISGADVPKLHEAGRYQEILTYCAIDTATTEAAYLLMRGQSGELQ